MSSTASAAPPSTDGGASPAQSLHGDARQFVTFFLRNETFAVPLAEVQEIIRMPKVVEVPMSPPSLEGLANLRGAVLPVASLRRIFRLDDARHDDSTRVVVINQGMPMGFVVDRMASVVTAEPHEIEGVEAIRSTVETDLLSGMIKQGTGMTMILDPSRLIEQEFRAQARDGARGLAAALSAAREQAPAAAQAAVADEIQLVSFEVAGQEYALPIEQVQEIVQVPAQISHVPKSGSQVIGVMTLRNRLLPLISLRRMFDLPAAPLDEHNRIVVIALDEGRLSVGIVMDRVKEVLRVGRNLVDPLPAMLSRGGDGDIQAICRLRDGKRLVSILSAEQMFHHRALREAAEAHAAAGDDSMQTESNDRRTGHGDDEEQFVVFRLAREEYGVPIDSVQEIVRVPDELTHVPKSPPFIEGVVNLRGAVLPVVDQRRRFGLTDAERNDRQRIMVFTIDGVRTGFIVDSVSEVLKIARSVIEPAPNLSAEQARLITRVANIEAQKRMILLLDVSQPLSGQEADALSGLSV